MILKEWGKRKYSANILKKSAEITRDQQVRWVYMDQGKFSREAVGCFKVKSLLLLFSVVFMQNKIWVFLIFFPFKKKSSETSLK